ncbi:hypothetical protein [Cystobacter fuscus]
MNRYFQQQMLDAHPHGVKSKDFAHVPGPTEENHIGELTGTWIALRIA